MPKRVTSSRWVDAPTKIEARDTFLTVYGETSTGKTTFALSAPGPIAFFNASEKIEGIVQPFAREKTIRIHDFSAEIDPKKPTASALPVWNEFTQAMLDAIGWARTIVLDTHSEAWELIRWARFGKLSQIKPHHYGPVNAEWLALMKRVRNSEGVNFIGVGQLKELYRNEKPTGKMVQSGQKQMDYLSDVVLRARWEKGDYSVEVEKPWWNAHAQGMEFENEDANFAGVMALITEREEEWWSE